MVFLFRQMTIKEKIESIEVKFGIYYIFFEPQLYVVLLAFEVE